MHEPEPTFHGIETIGVVATALLGQVEATEKQLEMLREVESARILHVLDEETLDGVEVLFTAVQGDADLYAEQLRRWRLSGLTSSEAEEVDQLERQVRWLRQRAKEAVAICARLREQMDGLSGYRPTTKIGDDVWLEALAHAFMVDFAAGTPTSVDQVQVRLEPPELTWLVDGIDRLTQDWSTTLSEAELAQARSDLFDRAFQALHDASLDSGPGAPLHAASSNEDE